MSFDEIYENIKKASTLEITHKYIDFDGKILDLKVSKAMFEILQHVTMFKHLGTYPKG